MRKISVQASKSLIFRRPFKKNNTRVMFNNLDNVYELIHHQTVIAYIDDDFILHITDCDGYRTVTTKERLNTLLYIAGSDYYIKQKQGVWYVYENDKLIGEFDEIDIEFKINLHKIRV